MVKMLWSSGGRKEVMDLLAAVWPAVDEAGRDRLAAEIIAGPPDEMLEFMDEAERTQSRDRRIFDRLIVLERLGEPPLTPALLREGSACRRCIPIGSHRKESALISTHGWNDGAGRILALVSKILKALGDPKLIETLQSEHELRDGLLEAWRQLALTDAARAMAVMKQLLRAGDHGPVDVWRHGLWGLRDGAKDDEARDRLLELLLEAPDALFATPDIANAATDILEAVSRGAADKPRFWRLFDRTLPVVVGLPENANDPEQGEWVSLAINRSLGRAAGAFFNAMFGRGLKVGQGIPEDLRARLDELVRPGERANRLARVIAASRLSYLFAVDSEWTSEALLPGFAWGDESEALALWQGYLWQSRIDAQLWAALKPHFLQLFTEPRLEQLVHYHRNLGQLLMIVGIEFGANELPRNETRNAIRTMPDDMRSGAVWWLARYLEQRTPDENQAGGDVDKVWVNRVAPWIRHFWPVDPECRNSRTSQEFGAAAIATHRAFPEALRLIVPLVIRTTGSYLVSRLENSQHPDAHPNETLRFLDSLIDPGTIHIDYDKLRRVLDRIAVVSPDLRQDQSYRQWDDWLRVRER